MNRIFFILLLCFIAFTTRADGSRYAPKSVLSEGRWVKVRVSENGIYKLAYADLRKMGFSDPAKVSVHGYGGWILDEDFSKNTYIDDAPAVAVWRGSDYLLFYGKGPVKWSYENALTNNKLEKPSKSDSIYQFVHTNNPYSMYGYYFVTDATEINEMKTLSSADGASLQINVFDDYRVYEKDEISIKDSGRDLFGESFEVRSSFTQEFQVPGITDDEGLVTVRIMSGANGNVSSSIDDFQFLNKEYVTGSFKDTYTKGVSFLRATKWTGAKSEQPKVTITYSPTATKTYLDYIRLQMKRRLQAYSEPYTFFRSLSARGNVSRFNIQNATAGMMVFDITDGLNPVRMETTLTGSELSFAIPADASLREFVLVDPSKTIPAPEQVGAVESQNLHALPKTDMIILAPPAFVGEAERLAAHHRSITRLSVEVVTPQQVYNEFSSGTPDATAIRRFMKMFYDRRSSDADAPRFLLLFGDGTYDNRKLTQTWKGVSMDNFVITYQTADSQGAASCVVEDYFGLLSDKHDPNGNLYNLDIHLGIGRFPVRSVAQAKAAVDKVINYALNKDGGSWKNQLCFVADDGSNSDGFTTEHMNQANQLSGSIEVNYPAYLMNKQFFDAYEKSSVGGKMSYPDVEANIINQLKEGALIINYTGHGNSTSWSDERVITDKQIQQYAYKHLPLWITATCDFTPFDAYQTSAGEYVFLNEKSGGIALYTTTRVAYSTSNFNLNMLLLKKIFERKSNGERLTLGEAIRATKQEYNYLDRVRFMLIGDPALTLNFPEYELRITEINGQPVGDSPIEFKALERITIKGEVYDEAGEIATDFKGAFSATIMDSQDSITTLDNNRTGRTFEYTNYRSRLQKVNANVTNGEFSFSFVVPSFNSYSGLAGKISMYALDETTNTEANGAFKNFKVGGTAPNPESDTNGPEIRAAYLNDSTFRDGDKVNDTPYFIAQLWDQSGVYIGGSSLGHDMILTIDNNFNYLNDYYQTLSDGREGIVQFPVPALSEGIHTAAFKVFDVLGNSSTYTFTFEVEAGLKPAISDLRAAPSPARESVTFMLTHNRPESDMEVTIRVYNLTGQLEWENKEKGSSEAFKTYNVSWDLTNGNGSRLRPGIYIYQAGIRTGNSSEATKAKKLVILGR